MACFVVCRICLFYFCLLNVVDVCCLSGIINDDYDDDEMICDGERLVSKT